MQLTFTTFLIAILAGCAVQPIDEKYADLDCEQLAIEADYQEQALSSLSEYQGSKSAVQTGDVLNAIGSLGFSVIEGTKRNSRTNSRVMQHEQAILAIEKNQKLQKCESENVE